MNRHAALAAIATLLIVTPSYGVLIDNFQTPQVLEVSGGYDINQVSGAGILSGWRDFSALKGSLYNTRVEAAGGVFTATFGLGGAFGMVWDGPTLSLPFQPNFGFGPMDLTDGGTSNALAFTVLFSDQPADIEFQVWQGGNRVDAAAVSVPGGIVSPQTYVIPFADFVPTNVNGFRADYSKINAVTNTTNYVVPTLAGGTLQLGTIETVFVPEPSTTVLACLGLALATGIRYRRWFRPSLTIAATVLFATPSYGVVIDNFQTPQSLVVSGDDLQQVSGPGIIGGYRDVGALTFGGGTASFDIQDGVLSFQTTTTAWGGVTWDGFPPNGIPTVPSFALDHVDLTEGGTLNALAVTVISSNLPFTLEFHMFSTDAPHDYYSLNVPGGIAAPQTFTIPFASFSTTSEHGEKANYQSILALGTWIFQDVPGVNFQLGTIETVFVPEPSSAALACLGIAGLACWRRRQLSGSHRLQHRMSKQHLKDGMTWNARQNPARSSVLSQSAWYFSASQPHFACSHS